MVLEEKECKGCNKILPLGEFLKNKSYPGDLDSLCIGCRTHQRLKAKELYFQKHKEYKAKRNKMTVADR